MMQKDATFSKDRTYRYTLHRTWDERKGVCLFLMLNPSTADENVLDATITRCLKFAGKWGYGGLAVGNLFSLRSTDSDGLLKVVDPVGPDNDLALHELVMGADQIIAAWGTFSKLKHILKPRIKAVKDILDFHGKCDKIHALQINKNGSPRHPLYTHGESKPIPYFWEA